LLKQASAKQIRSGELTRKHGYLVVAMRFYPRGLRKNLRDEYRSDLAPELKLFKDFKKNQARFGHDRAFEKARYEKRFSLSERAMEHLRELSELSREKDVYLACQCEIGERCHREILLLLARKKFGARIGKVFHEYPTVMRRAKREF
jgi:uncharacterized protein YeaO (DUF488 family)